MEMDTANELIRSKIVVQLLQDNPDAQKVKNILKGLFKTCAVGPLTPLSDGPALLGRFTVTAERIDTFENLSAVTLKECEKMGLPTPTKREHPRPISFQIALAEQRMRERGMVFRVNTNGDIYVAFIRQVKRPGQEAKTIGVYPGSEVDFESRNKVRVKALDEDGSGTGDCLVQELARIKEGQRNGKYSGVISVHFLIFSLEVKGTSEWFLKYGGVHAAKLFGETLLIRLLWPYILNQLGVSYCLNGGFSSVDNGKHSLHSLHTKFTFQG